MATERRAHKRRVRAAKQPELDPVTGYPVPRALTPGAKRNGNSAALHLEDRLAAAVTNGKANAGSPTPELEDGKRPAKRANRWRSAAANERTARAAPAVSEPPISSGGIDGHRTRERRFGGRRHAAQTAENPAEAAWLAGGVVPCRCALFGHPLVLRETGRCLLCGH